MTSGANMSSLIVVTISLSFKRDMRLADNAKRLIVAPLYVNQGELLVGRRPFTAINLRRQ